MHIALPISDGHVLMATDALESMGQKLTFGNNAHICVSPDSREEADRIFKGLSEGGKIEMPIQDMFWGGYFLIDALDLNDAIDIAARIPGARIGTVEVRPVTEVEGLPADT